MRLALARARGARGRSWPNPPVGAVVFRGDRVLGSGRTQPPPGPHAEIVALANAERAHGASSLRGASLAVTLEPCNHTGRTGPCSERLLEAGLARVYVGHADPHALARGGSARLRRAGVDVQVGVLEALCREQHRGFLSWAVRRRPFVVLKLAASLDGRIATARGESRWISAEASREAAHHLRTGVDAILVGASTARADDPELTARRGGRVLHRPVRVLADTRLRVPLTSKLFRGTGGPTWVLCGRSAPASRRRELERRGAVLIPTPLRRGRIDLRAALRELARRGLTELLVEGGGELAASLIREDLVDELHWFAAPRLLGADARPAVGPLGLRLLRDAPALRIVALRRLGADVHLRAVPERALRARAERA
ncbi:MAG TPA: bifunctional diaminohydroxyphosphoribosylaminopyrimidine deaminase/5-amino-6-(5-phosphoribosylamino)uracil reductase RibD [Myxococcota bacterium]|nr:bifunctional diaminohydroxyphosphoribosylaminopyrimidine deaminase/5-amino-6-(5-phosphoribosylamino)uracil reductase RibD [Myxococcota bacterium]